MTVCNATIGLMLAIKEAVGDVAPGQFALMQPSSFPHGPRSALVWVDAALVRHQSTNLGSRPLMPSQTCWPVMRARLRLPYATFGYNIDLERYPRITSQLELAVVVDGAASLGSFDAQGRGFGSGFGGSVVYSMHATKSFAVGEAGLIYSADRIALPGCAPWAAWLW